MNILNSKMTCTNDEVEHGNKVDIDVEMKKQNKFLDEWFASKTKRSLEYREKKVEESNLTLLFIYDTNTESIFIQEGDDEKLEC